MRAFIPKAKKTFENVICRVKKSKYEMSLDNWTVETLSGYKLKNSSRPSCLLHILLRLSLLELLDDLSLRMARPGFDPPSSDAGGTGVPGGRERDGDGE